MYQCACVDCFVIEIEGKLHSYAKIFKSNHTKCKKGIKLY